MNGPLLLDDQITKRMDLATLPTLGSIIKRNGVTISAQIFRRKRQDDHFAQGTVRGLGQLKATPVAAQSRRGIQRNRHG